MRSNIQEILQEQIESTLVRRPGLLIMALTRFPKDRLVYRIERTMPSDPWLYIKVPFFKKVYHIRLLLPRIFFRPPKLRASIYPDTFLVQATKDALEYIDKNGFQSRRD